MRNNIAYFEKTSSSKVIFWAKLNAKINSALISPIIFTLLWLVFSKEAILFLIYLLGDKANNPPNHLLVEPRYYHGDGSKIALLPSPW